MKRSVFIKYIQSQDCILLREGSKHSLYKNLLNENQATVPRHNEIDDNLCKKIYCQLNIKSIK